MLPGREWFRVLLDVAILFVKRNKLSEEKIFSVHWVHPVYVLVSWYMCQGASLTWRSDFNSTDGFRYRLWWVRLYLLIAIKIVVCLPSKNFGGNYVTSHVFLSFILIFCWKCPLGRLMPGYQLLWVTFHRVPLCMCVCACVIFIVSSGINFFALSNKLSYYNLFHTHWVYPCLGLQKSPWIKICHYPCGNR
jgi:hypothetical protein